MPCDYSKYPSNWKQVRQQILERAGHRCEQCGVHNYAVGWRINGIFQPLDTAYLDEWHENDRPDDDWEPQPLRYKEAFRLRDLVNEVGEPEDALAIVVVLTIAHIHDRNPENCDPANLQSLCQRCHLLHDADQHKHNAAVTRQRKADAASGQTQLFEITRL